MLPQPDPKALLLEHLATVDRISDLVARRNGFRGDDAADFGAWVRLKLVEDDYSTLRKFRGESSLKTFLGVVVAMLGRDYRVKNFGRWRPSMAARRLGDLAVRLEALIYRRGMTLAEAGEVLRTSGDTDLTDAELAKILAKLPVHEPLRPIPVGSGALELIETHSNAESDLVLQAAFENRFSVEQALEEAMRDLSEEDRIMLHLRFWDGLSIADVARGLCVDQKPLYRRLKRILRDLGARIARKGISRQTLKDLLDEAPE